MVLEALEISRECSGMVTAILTVSNVLRPKNLDYFGILYLDDIEEFPILFNVDFFPPNGHSLSLLLN